MANQLDDLKELRNGFAGKLRTSKDFSLSSPYQSNGNEKKKQKPVINEEMINQLEGNNWFFPETNKTSAEAILADCNEDTFLVRTEKNDFWVSFITKDGRFSNSLIKMEEVDGDLFFFMEESHRRFESIVELVRSAVELDQFTPFHKRRRQSLISKTPSNRGGSRLSFNSVNENGEKVMRTSHDSDSKEELEESSGFTVKDIEKEYQQVMKGNNDQQIAALKETVKAMIENFETRIQEFDKNLLRHSLDMRESINLSSEDNRVYVSYNQAITKLKRILIGLRLRGDEFLIVHKGENKMFRVAPDGQMHFCTIKKTSKTEDLAPSDMSEYCYFNVKVIEGGRGVLYEVKSAKMAHFIDEVAKIATESIVVSADVVKGGCVIYWKNGKKSSFVTAIPEDVFELVEVVGTHLKSFNQSTIKQIQMIKDIYRTKTTQFDSDSTQHLFLLSRLWKATHLNGEMELVSREWKKIGFQGTNPSTDFRGMGLLGLLNLLYFAENYSTEVLKIVDSHRDYPWAASGINITNMIMNILGINAELVTLHPSVPAWHTPLLSMFYHANNDDTFDELYSQAFLLFDQLWIHNKATYMDFPTIISKLQRSVEELLARRPTSVEQLCSWIEHRRKSFT
eukprot:TRINITY_DN5270_c0_g1_i3.p1 TRINITY_DN5270_c0_g1~~TRINITY_DN5270_c0_g1_i3.p1  ORF type:complete len:623 (+),score=239.23 TRINITY_DN5270_c0_g1_i3:163-2031(+)